MSSQEELHSLRMEITLRRQPRHCSVLAALSSLLESHPYDLADNELRELERIDAFMMGSKGLVASPPREAFLYGLCALQSLTNTNYVTWNSQVSSHEVAHQLFEELKRDLASSSDSWLPLSRYAHGSLSGYRKLTWWTSSDRMIADVIKGVLELGLLSVPELAILLRCPTEYVRSERISRVPTAIDGFLLEVFHPTADSDSPDWGMTINLCDGETLCTGSDQYVLGPIEVDQVFFRPVHINESMRAALTIESGQRLWTALETYYKTLRES